MKRTIIAFLMILLLAASVAWAQQKIGVVNMRTIFDQYSGKKEAEAVFEREMEDLNRQVTAKEERIKALADSIESMRYVASEERIRAKQRTLETLQQEYIQFMQDAEVTAAQRNEELTRPIEESILQAAGEIGERENFDLILDAGAGIVVYSKPEYDLTDQVLQKLEELRASTTE
jgi:outer membrane protein